MQKDQALIQITKNRMPEENIILKRRSINIQINLKSIGSMIYDRNIVIWDKNFRLFILKMKPRI